MNADRETIRPQARAAQFVQDASGFFNYYLTHIAIVVVVIGLVLTIIGPGRALLARLVSSAPSGASALAPGLAGGAMIEAAVDRAAGEPALARELIPYTIIPDRPRDRIVTYVVQPGDTITGIAATFGLDRSSIYWANNESLGGNVHMLARDMELYILPVDGAYHKSDGQHSLQWIANKYSVEVEDIIESEYNELEEYDAADVPDWGMRIVVPGGQGEVADWRPPVYETVDSRGNVTRGFMPGMGGSCAAISGGGGTGVWVSPLPGGFTFTAPYDYFHSGLDLAANLGAAVVAADTGRVIFAGWNDWGYGNLVVLDHGNGWTTYYAHLSSVGVGCGQTVQRGGYVGGVGSTGNSTGYHLHFEMRWGHNPDNPAYYIGF
jgi:murein DD-endopeptidase MepM/ murein hydrolase activator NlpD